MFVGNLLEKRNLKFKIIVISVCIYFFSFFLLIIMSLSTITEQMEEQLTEDGITLTKQIAKNLEYANLYEDKIDALLTDKIKTVAYLVGEQEQVDNDYLNKVADVVNVQEINIIDENRKVIYSNLSNNLGFIYSKNHPMDPLLTGKITEINEDIRKSTSDDFFYKYGGRKLKSGRTIQVGIQVDNIEKLKSSLTRQDIVESIGKEDNVVYALIIDKNLKAIAHSDPSRIGVKLNDKGSKLAAIEGKVYSARFYYEKEKVHTQDVLIPLYENGEHVGAINIGLSLNNLNEALKKTILKSITIGISYFIITIIILIILLDKLFKPLGELVRISGLISQGDLTQRIKVKEKDEVGALSSSFNSMVDSLQNKMNENNKLVEEVIQYDKLKTEFFANISHELRTPINVIFSALQLIELHNKESEDIEINHAFNKYKDTIKQNIYRLIRLVNNLIDITKIDSGFFNINLGNYNIISVIEDITLSVANYIENKSIELTFDTEIEEKIMACDPYALERIMLNLLSNAVKFTKPGGKIKVNIFDKITTLQISIIDTGVGIQQDKLEVIFQRFRQAEDLNTRNHEGSGIGLALVKELVEMHEGKISVKSEYGIGTRFLIELPIKVLDEKTEERETQAHIEQSHIEKINIEFSDIYNNNLQI